MGKVQISGRHFCAELTFDGDVVDEADPFLRHMLGWDRDQVKDRCKKKGWEIVHLPSPDDYTPSPIFSELYRRTGRERIG